jgi:hypothetical protein
LGLSAWKVILIAGVVLLLFLPRFIRMGGMLKGLGERFSFDGERAQPPGEVHGGAADGHPVIDGDTGMVVQPKSPAPQPSFAERIGMALGRLTRRITQRLSA